MELILLIAMISAIFINIVLYLLIRNATVANHTKLVEILNTTASLERDQFKIEQSVREEISRNREEISLSNKQSRDELGSSIKSFETSLLARMNEVAILQKNQLDTFTNQLSQLTQSNEQKLESLRQSVDTKLQVLTEETKIELKSNGATLNTRMIEIASLQQNQLDSFAKQLSNLIQMNEQKLEQMRETIEQRVKALQNENSLKLDQMRTVVDEKLHATLEQRLGESFKIVSDRLELVHKGLGEMQSLANGVGDLKKVLTNVKTRGTWGEVQLGNILEDILSPDQYDSNVAVKKGSERVEYAIKLPGQDQENDCLWLPIDAKFPMEDYQRLLDAYDQGDPVLAEQAAKQLEIRIKSQAKDISTKYIEPPATTDFAIMFLPTEGLYAEILRRPGLFEGLRQDFRIIVSGPTTLAALVNSLSMGFRTLAIQKRSSEVWTVLGAIKTEFGKFGGVLEKTQKKLQEASNIIDDAARRSRAMERKLKNVEALPENESLAMLGDEYADEIASANEMSDQ